MLEKINFMLLSMLILLFSCTKEETPYRQENRFQEMLDHLVLECPEETSSDFFKCEIDSTHVCYYNGVDGMNKRIDYGIVYITKGASTLVSNNQSNILGKRIVFGIVGNNKIGYQDWIEFSTPIFDENISKEDYLDSLFAVSYHKVEDYYNKNRGLTVSLNMLKRIDTLSGNGGLIYPISSSYGSQEESYIYFIKVEKLREGNTIYYDIEMEVQCDLYYFKAEDGYHQYKKKGKWGRLTNGLLKMKVAL